MAAHSHKLSQQQTAKGVSVNIATKERKEKAGVDTGNLNDALTSLATRGANISCCQHKESRPDVVDTGVGENDIVPVK